MKKKQNIPKITINLIFILICSLGFSQVEIRGKVISTYTNEPLRDGYRIKPNIEKHPTSFSDKEGNYLIEYLEPNTEYEVVLSIIGYDDQKFIVETNDGISYKDIEIKPNCDWIKKAETDWNNNEPQFLLFGSIAPIMNTKSDDNFEEKYHIKYYDFGCSPPTYECIVMYNERTAELMDLRYGKKWRKKARPDIVGL